MTKKDLRLILIVGAAVGFSSSRSLLNVLPQVHLGILGRFAIFVFFAGIRAVRALGGIPRVAVLEGSVPIRAVRGRGDTQFFH